MRRRAVRRRDLHPDAKVTTDGQDQAVPGTAVDNAGNTLTDHATVSIDTVKPTITGAPDRAANTNGWYAGDVTVSFTCADALSGIADCASPDTLGEGKAQSAKGTATDTAGNTDDATVGPINVDKTAPTLSGAATTDPNAAGWYQGDVTINWTAADALSGLDGADAGRQHHRRRGHRPDGRHLGARPGRQRDVGEERCGQDRPDRPEHDGLRRLRLEQQRRHGQAHRRRQPLRGRRDALPARPGRRSRTGTSVTIDTEGVHTLQVWSVDVAGNVEAQKNIEVKIDKTAPGISHTQAPAANARSWNNSDVTVTFTCTDSGSGIASCTAPVTKAEGAARRSRARPSTTPATRATDETTVSIDKTKPTVTGSLSADANGNGWFNADVTATFTCADQDGLSGVLSCPAAKTLGEGANQSAGGTATDAADNASDPFSITGINVDKTDPTLSGAATTAPNGNGWYKGDVTVDVDRRRRALRHRRRTPRPTARHRRRRRPLDRRLGDRQGRQHRRARRSAASRSTGTPRAPPPPLPAAGRAATSR